MIEHKYSEPNGMTFDICNFNDEKNMNNGS